MQEKNDKRGFPRLKNNAVSFHMPGHKGRLIFPGISGEFLKYDVTELPGMDDLLQPEGWIRELTQRISSFYGSIESRILVGGSTAGILGAILGTVKDYERKALSDQEAKKKFSPKILINRNAHISVYNSIEISGAVPLYLAPEVRDGVPSHFDIDKFSAVLKEDVDILVLTYPFYQGGRYDIGMMIETARRLRPNITIIVDEAHGAHLVLAEHLYRKRISSLSLGADIVVQSFHKTLPALGQTAVLHYGKTVRGRELAAQCTHTHSIEWYLKALQTTSPSYLFLKSLSDMMDILESDGVELYASLLKNIERFYERCGRKPFDYEGFAVQDESKLLICATNRDAFIESGIYPEMEFDGKVLFLSSIANTDEDFERLAKAVCIEDSLKKSERRLIRYGLDENSPAEKGMYTEIFAYEAVGRRSAETLVLYPPGTPLIVKGERFEKEAVDLLGETKVKVYLKP